MCRRIKRTHTVAWCAHTYTHTCTCRHTHRHAPLVRPPYRPAVCWGADEGIAKGKNNPVSVCKESVWVCACVCVHVRAYSFSSETVITWCSTLGIHFFPPLPAISEKAPWLLSPFFFFLLQSPEHTPTSSFEWLHKVWVHGHTTACTHRPGNFFL